MEVDHRYGARAASPAQADARLQAGRRQYPIWTEQGFGL